MADADKKSSHFVAKVMATVFGAVVAPVVVALAVKMIPDMLAGKHETTAQAATPTTKKGPQTLELVNANLGENFYSYGWSEKLMKDDKNDAVDAAVFKFVEVPPSIFVSAAGGKPALLETKRDDFENYTLLVDFKWGEKTYGDRETKRRAAQILLNAGGPDGLFGLRPQCVAVDLSEGSAGGIQLVGADRKVLCKAKVTESPDKKRRVFDPNVPQPVNLASGEAGWNGVIARLGFPEPKDYKDEKGWHPRGDTLLTDLKPGQWNKVMIEARGASLKVFVNNMVRPVNEIHGLNVKKGRIGFTSNLADYSIGRITVELPGQ